MARDLAGRNRPWLGLGLAGRNRPWLGLGLAGRNRPWCCLGLGGLVLCTMYHPPAALCMPLYCEPYPPTSLTPCSLLAQAPLVRGLPALGSGQRIGSWLGVGLLALVPLQPGARGVHVDGHLLKAHQLQGGGGELGIGIGIGLGSGFEERTSAPWWS